MIDFPIVDSHVHLLDPEHLGYAWTRNAPQLNRVVLPEHLTDAAKPVGIDRFVFVEVDVDEGEHLDEAAWIAEQAQHDPRLQGMVAALPLEQGAAVEADLERLSKHKILRGIRRLIQTQPDPDFCIRPDFIAGLKLLSSRDLVFDICVFHHHLPNVIKMVGQCPEVRFILDHIGKPPIKAGGMDPWRQDLVELATFDNVHCKISGVTTEADHKAWTRDQIRPYIEHAIETFGFDRSMYGGDWHVLELAGTYPDWVDIVDEITRGTSEEDRRKLFRDNAIRFYRLDG
jgi:predicted TIM-barrel fold metal-dependent hydrolase